MAVDEHDGLEWFDADALPTTRLAHPAYMKLLTELLDSTRP